MMNTLVSGVALLLACAGLFAYDQITFRQGLVRTLSAQAQIIGSNSVSAILFNDPQAASQTLSALQSSPNIASAGILTLDQRPLAQYTRETGNEILSLPPLRSDQVEVRRFGSNHVVLVREILSEGKPIGFVYLRADLHEIDQRLKRYAAIAGSVLLLSLLAAILVSSSFRKSVAQPIEELAETAQSVSRDKDYSVRVPRMGRGDEFSILVDSFNEMLGQIQQRDTALQKARNELEHRVSDRTRDLLFANEQLSERTHELVSANRELEVFSYSVSHDLRGPLDALNGFSYVLLNQHGSMLSPQVRELIEHMRKSSKRMDELIDDLLDLSRITATTMHREEIDLSSVARSIMEELCRNDPGRKVEFVAPLTVQAFADARLMRIVLENLLRNAWKYTSHHEKAQIEFGQTAESGQIVYFVRDDGSGFDPLSTVRLFQPFQRLHSETEFPGSGIGLATVRRIILRHGGEAWAQGAIEKGATFYFTLGSGRSDAGTHRAATLLSEFKES